MAAELATLERKVDAVLAKVDLAIARMDQALSLGKPGITQKTLARMLGVSPKTIGRRVADKKIRLKDGLVPWSEAQKFLS